jgi:hypothetical protein
MRKCWLLGDACALGMMFVPGGMVLVGKGNILSYVHGSNNLISGVLFFRSNCSMEAFYLMARIFVLEFFFLKCLLLPTNIGFVGCWLSAAVVST